MKDKAKEYHNRLVLPEATEARTLRAARILVDQQIPAELFLIGKKAEVDLLKVDYQLKEAETELKKITLKIEGCL